MSDLKLHNEWVTDQIAKEIESLDSKMVKLEEELTVYKNQDRVIREKCT